LVVVFDDTDVGRQLTLVGSDTAVSSPRCRFAPPTRRVLLLGIRVSLYVTRVGLASPPLSVISRSSALVVNGRANYTRPGVRDRTRRRLEAFCIAPRRSYRDVLLLQSLV